MPPLDMTTCPGVSVEGCVVGLSEPMPNHRGVCDAREGDVTAGVATAAVEAVERRRSRVLKMRQTRSRNAAARTQQVYTSAEESDEEEDLKPELAGLRGDAPAECASKQVWKKQQRMIRNRESAALSRKRKRDRIESLEQQVARLMEENRGLRHRLAKYEASPQQARYKYARQTATANGTTASSMLVDRNRRNQGSPTALAALAAVARKHETEEEAAKDAQGGGSCSGNSAVSCLNSRESAVETAAHGLNAATSSSPEERRPLRSSSRRRRTSIASVPTSTSSRHYGLRSGSDLAGSKLSSLRSRRESRRRSSTTSEGGVTTLVSLTAPSLAPPQPLINSGRVKMEVPSNEDTVGDPAIVIDGDLASSTGDEPMLSPQQFELSRSLSLEQPSRQQQQQEQHQDAVFDKDDDAACDDLLFDILTGDGQPHASDGFFSLLGDDMITSLSPCVK